MNNLTERSLITDKQLMPLRGDGNQLKRKNPVQRQNSLEYKWSESQPKGVIAWAKSLEGCIEADLIENPSDYADLY